MEILNLFRVVELIGIIIIVGFGVARFVHKYREWTGTQQMIEKTIQSSLAINDELKAILARIPNASRAYILEFHNGGVYLSGKHPVKFTCEYEQLNGVQTAIPFRKSEPISRFPRVFERLTKDGEYFLIHPGELHVGQWRGFLESLNINATVMKVLKDPDKNIKAVVGVDFLSDLIDNAGEELDTKLNAARSGLDKSLSRLEYLLAEEPQTQSYTMRAVRFFGRFINR